jgi:hypothetical protein
VWFQQLGAYLRSIELNNGCWLLSLHLPVRCGYCLCPRLHRWHHPDRVFNKAATGRCQLAVPCLRHQGPRCPAVLPWCLGSPQRPWVLSIAGAVYAIHTNRTPHPSTPIPNWLDFKWTQNSSLNYTWLVEQGHRIIWLHSAITSVR